jgi:hypothetical protein
MGESRKIALVKAHKTGEKLKKNRINHKCTTQNIRTQGSESSTRSCDQKRSLQITNQTVHRAVHQTSGLSLLSWKLGD